MCFIEGIYVPFPLGARYLIIPLNYLQSIVAVPTTTVSDFSLEDVRQFLSHWHRLVAIGQMGANEDAENYAKNQTAQLLNAIQNNERVRDLAINPLMLTVIALVHRDRVKLPDRRAELYAEAVDVLLGKWDEARGVDEIRILDDRPFDAGDRRLLLQNIALHMHEHEKKELEAAELRGLLQAAFKGMTKDEAEARRASERFLTVIEERMGLLTARGEGVYAFSHLTFQEYLTALAVAARDDYVDYILKNSAEAWWREVILLTAGYLSTQSKERTTRLIDAIYTSKTEPELFHNLVLAAECLRDVGSNRVTGNIESILQNTLKKELSRETPRVFDLKNAGVFERWTGKAEKKKADSEAIRHMVIQHRNAAANALARIGGQQFWTQPYGEPEWIPIPAGKFWMGEGSEARQIDLPDFQISRVPITNAQYALFVKATEREMPRHWHDRHIPKGLENHPVVNVTWYDATAYCEWLSKVTGKCITLPSEEEWEKAARGDKDKRTYPWGDDFDSSKCNSGECGLDSTTPVGIFLGGASLYGVLDMSGNIYEWVLGTFRVYHGDLLHRIRGGSFDSYFSALTCSFHSGSLPYTSDNRIGFRTLFSS